MVRLFKFFMYSMVAFGLVGCAIYQAVSLLDRSTVYRSWSTKECVFIEHADGSRSGCETYDPNIKYSFGWVE